MLHLQKGDHVRLTNLTFGYYLQAAWICLRVWVANCLHMHVCKGFSFSDWGVLHKEKAFSRICKAFCIQCRGYAEVRMIFFYCYLQKRCSEFLVCHLFPFSYHKKPLILSTGLDVS